MDDMQPEYGFRTLELFDYLKEQVDPGTDLQVVANLVVASQLNYIGSYLEEFFNEQNRLHQSY